MARHLFLGDMASWATAMGADETSVDSQSGIRALFIPGASITFWSAQTGGTQYTDLLDAIGTPITSAVADDSGEFTQVQGPDTDPATWYMWADGSGGAGPRRVVVATDVGDVLSALESTVNDMADQLDELSSRVDASMGVVSYDTVGLSWPARPTGDSRRYAWLGPTAPTVGGTGMIENFDIWFNTAPAAS